MREFVVARDPVNQLAEHSPGFVWRLCSSESHGATTVRNGSRLVFVNLSLWESYETLHAFGYRSPHGAYVRRRARWFEPIRQPSTVLWWVRSGKWPTVEEALRRLRYLQAHGPSPQGLHPPRRFEPDRQPSRRNRR
jgi:Domain of unknown function (DUF3291)